MLSLGVIDVLNVLPIYYGIDSQRENLSCEIVKGKVTELNEKLAKGDLDISVISSYEYALHPELYYILPNLSVSSDGAVGSIYLFVDQKLESLQSQVIHLTNSSLTSIHLLKYLLRNQPVSFTYNQSDSCVGKLLIADEAIYEFYNKKHSYVYDLGKLWKEETGFPFVFALWAVRRDSFEKSPEEVKKVAQYLEQQKTRTKETLYQIALEKHENIFPNVEKCMNYFEQLSYELSEIYQEGFLSFQKEMVRLGYLKKVAPIVFLPAV